MAAVDTVIDNIVEHIVNPIIGVVFALGFALFLWGVAAYIFQSGDENARENGRNHMLWGLAGMFIMVTVGGIIKFIQATLGL
ncbi:MAG: hypothetical protein HGB03_02045 [Candidatus Yonathbacteria bacterium]|nr:hypothetical protein [Candidatus Yonathbacteria bacterium]NTW48036.1 hypothetical protein [Candidatus Yonathbacteria bacterium]